MECGWKLDDVEDIGRAVLEILRERPCRVSVNSDCTFDNCLCVDCSAVESISKKAESDMSGITISWDELIVCLETQLKMQEIRTFLALDGAAVPRADSVSTGLRFRLHRGPYFLQPRRHRR